MNFIYFNPSKDSVSNFSNLMKFEDRGVDSKGQEHTIISYPLLPTDDSGRIIELPILVYDPSQPPYYYDPNQPQYFNSKAFLSQYSSYLQPGSIYFISATYFPTPSHRLKQGVFTYVDLIDAPQLYVKHIMLCVVSKDDQGRAVFIMIETPSGYSSLTKYLDTNKKDDRYCIFGITKLKFPRNISLEYQAAYVKNITTIAAILEIHSEFPNVSINRGDMLGVTSLKEAIKTCEMALLCVYGDERGKAWMMDELNKMYCSEMLSISLDIGLNFLLTQSNLNIVAQKYFSKTRQADFVNTVSQRINTGEFLNNISKKKKIPHSKYLKDIVGIVDTKLNDIPALNENHQNIETYNSELAIKPDTFADISFRYFLRFYPYKKISGLQGQSKIEAIRYNEAVSSARLQKFNLFIQMYESMYKTFLHQDNYKQWNIFKLTFNFYLRQREISSLDLGKVLLQKTRESIIISNEKAGLFTTPMRWLGSNIMEDNIMENKGQIDFELIAWLMPFHAFYKYLIGNTPE